jgi:hypothetical protein
MEVVPAADGGRLGLSAEAQEQSVAPVDGKNRVPVR